MAQPGRMRDRNWGSFNGNKYRNYFSPIHLHRNLHRTVMDHTLSAFSCCLGCFTPYSGLMRRGPDHRQSLKGFRHFAEPSLLIQFLPAVSIVMSWACTTAYLSIIIYFKRPLTPKSMPTCLYLYIYVIIYRYCGGGWSAGAESRALFCFIF